MDTLREVRFFHASGAAGGAAPLPSFVLRLAERRQSNPMKDHNAWAGARLLVLRFPDEAPRRVRPSSSPCRTSPSCWECGACTGKPSC